MALLEILSALIKIFRGSHRIFRSLTNRNCVWVSYDSHIVTNYFNCRRSSMAHTNANGERALTIICCIFAVVLFYCGRNFLTGRNILCK